MNWAPPTPEDSTTMWKEINNNKHDRVVAIVCNSYIDTLLEGCLRQRLSDSVHSKMFGHRGILQSQAAKIDLAQGIGLLSSDAAEDLIYLNRIRNRFAHYIKVDTFEHPDIKKLCASLKLMPALFEQVARINTDPVEIKNLRSMHARTPPRIQFTNTAGSIANYLAQVWRRGPMPIQDPSHIKYWSDTWQPPPAA